MSGVLVVLENESSLEALAAAQQIGAELDLKVFAAVFGGGDKLTGYKLDKIHSIEHELLAHYTPDGYTAAVAQLPFNELRELQQLLVRAGYDVGKVDGVMGQQSRSAVKAMQVKLGLPADSWPTAELLARMRGPRAAAAPNPAPMGLR